MTSLRGKNVSAPRTAIVVAIESGICKRNAFHLWLVGARASQSSCCPLFDAIFQDRPPLSCVYLLGVNIYICLYVDSQHGPSLATVAWQQSLFIFDTSEGSDAGEPIGCTAGDTGPDGVEDARRDGLHARLCACPADRTDQ